MKKDKSYYQISNDKLDTLLYGFTSVIGNCNPFMYDVCSLLYNTGIRVNEVFDISRWDVYPSGGFVLATSKKGNSRIISSELIPIDLQECYKNKRLPDYITPAIVNYSFNRYLPSFYFGDKKSRHCTHSFRYNYIKRMSVIYTDIKMLANHIGHTSVETTALYLNADIFTTSLILAK